jgi:hypothetical protein
MTGSRMPVDRDVLLARLVVRGVCCMDGTPSQPPRDRPPLFSFALHPGVESPAPGSSAGIPLSPDRRDGVHRCID